MSLTEKKSCGVKFLRRVFSSLHRHHDDGQSIIEFALCLPILLLVVTGITTFGLAMNNYLELTDAVGVGSRLLAVSRNQGTDPCSATANAVYAAAPGLKKANMTFSFNINGSAYSGTSCTAGAASLQAGTPAQVVVTYPCSLAVYGANYAPSCLLKAQTTEIVQ